MNISINSVLSSLIVVIIAVFSLSLSNAATDLKKEDIIICHGFGEIKFEEQYQSKCEFADYFMQSKYRGRVMHCDGIYNLEGQILKKNVISVYIYDKKDGVKNDLLISTYSKPFIKTLFKSYKDGDIMKYCNGQLERRYWVSNNIQISITSYFMKINEQLFNDYVDKYPPTERLSEEDYNVQTIFKKEIERSYETIIDYEKDRKSKDKKVRLQAAGIQCERENAIRCWSGLSGDGKSNGCKVTIIQNNEERLTAWAELKATAMKMDIMEDNISWNSVKEPLSKCNSSDDFDNLLKALNVTQEDYERWYEEERNNK